VERRYARDSHHAGGNAAQDVGELKLGVEQMGTRLSHIPDHAGKAAWITEPGYGKHVDMDSKLPNLVCHWISGSLMEHTNARLETAAIQMVQRG
jgi:hypothetical protein